MRIATLITSFFLLFAGLFLLGAGPAKYSVITVEGPTMGNHELDCTVIRPWASGSRPTEDSYPVIGWANGWGYTAQRI